MFNHGTQQFESSFYTFKEYCGKQHHNFATIGRKFQGMYFVLNVQVVFMCTTKKLRFIIWFKMVHQVCNYLHTFVFNLCFMDRGSSALAMVMDASWFKSNHGLCNKGRNVFTLTTWACDCRRYLQAPWVLFKQEWVDQMFNEKNVKLVKEFYLKVISKIQPPNHEFFL
jgi:hypothetical protein